MGLIDRDYMHEQQSVTPSAETSATKTLLIVLISVAIVFSVYKLAQKDSKKVAPNPIAEQRSPRITPSGPHQESLPTQRRSGPYANEASHGADVGSRVVTKCVFNGSVSYGDSPCTRGARTHQVTTRADQNILAPVRITESTQTEAVSSPAAALIAQNSAASEYSAKTL
jgi:hypothetical protein